MGVTIRRADLGDVDAIVAFGVAVVPEHYTPILGQRAAQAQLAWWTPERIAPAIEGARVHVATNERRELVGACQTGEAGGEQVIWKLYLAPEYRGRSLGVELLRHAISALPEETDHVYVEHFAGNTSAARFYERHGFEVIRTDLAPAGFSPGNTIVWRRLQLS
jgi:ribosomal protein S18 acetylase RimI-like enzyme